MIKTIDYVCGMNFVRQYQEAIIPPSRRSLGVRRLIYQVVEEYEEYKSRKYEDGWGPFGLTYDIPSIQDGHIWFNRGQVFLSFMARQKT